jgi:predicted DNA-binding helix-hairpin-helix protein
MECRTGIQLSSNWREIRTREEYTRLRTALPLPNSWRRRGCGAADTAAWMRQLNCATETAFQSIKETDTIEINIAAMSAAARFVMDMAMDLNSATEEELQLVPGIGKETAKDIVAMRRRIDGFRSIDELKKITALRRKQFEGLKKYFFIGRSGGNGKREVLNNA